MLRICLLLTLLGCSSMAAALDKNDVGIYAIIDNDENAPTDKYLLSFSLTNGIWNLDAQLGAKKDWPEGSTNPTLTILSSKNNHVFHRSTPGYLREVLGLSESDLKEGKFSCINSPGLAFCSLIAPHFSNEKLYMLFVLNDGLGIGSTPNTVKLKKLTNENVDSNSAKLDKRLIGEWQGQVEAGKKCPPVVAWKSSRYADGKFEVILYADLKKTNETGRMHGTWWVEKNKYFEKLDEASSPTVYIYNFLNSDVFHYALVDKDLSAGCDVYEFTDHRTASQ